MSSNKKLSASVLDLDCDAAVAQVTQGIRHVLGQKIHRRGLVVAMSGGIDSSVCAALAVRAIGPKKVFGLLLPERDSSAQSTSFGKLLANHLGIEYLEQDIAPTLEAIGCYKWRDEAIRKTFPEYTEHWKNKIVLTGGLEGRYNRFKLVVQSPQDEVFEKVLGLQEYLTIVAATNYKQRIRKTIEYFHADRLHYAVVGTPNRLEYDQGFFVKNGDGSADIKPIAHLYKTQVYGLARHLELPQDICQAQPTTDTYSMAQGQDEFYFGLPYHQMDLALWSYNNDVGAEELAEFLGITEQQATSIYTDIEAKRRTTHYMHQAPILLEEIQLRY